MGRHNRFPDNPGRQSFLYFTNFRKYFHITIGALAGIIIGLLIAMIRCKW